MDQALAAIHQANPLRQPLTLTVGRQGETLALLVDCPADLRAIVLSQLYGQYPDCRIDELPDGAAIPAGHEVFEASLGLHRDLFPIRRYPQLEDALNRVTADPLTALLTALAAERRTPLSCHIEISVRPVRAAIRTRYQKILRRLARPFFHTHHRLAHCYLALAVAPGRSGRLLGWLLGRLATRGDHVGKDTTLSTSSSRLHDREEDLQAAGDKLGRLLFDTQIRLVATAERKHEAAARAKLREIAGAFGQFSMPRLATFHVARTRRHAHSFLLSTEELATLFHLPTLTVRAPTMTTVDSREFEPPVRLPTPKHDAALAVLGRTTFRGRSERFGILPDDRRRHIIIEGKTGMGKTTLLHHLIASDIAAGRGVALLDPHGDLCEAVLASVPSGRTNDVILFDAGDASYPLAFNILACGAGLSRPLVASSILSAFKKLYGEFWGPRMEHIFRNALLLLLEVPGTSLVSLLRLLSDGKYRNTLIAKAEDPVVRAFWQREFAGLPPKFQAEALAPLQNKIGHFVSSPLLRHILGQSKSSLDLRKTMDDGKILLVNLSKGRIGDDASALLGSFLVTALQLAAMSRADVPEDQRRDFFLYVDEFQNYATDSFATILSEARKYRLGLTVANQYLAQMDEATLAAVFGNIGTLIAFQVGAQDAEILAEQFGGDLQTQDLLTLPRFQAYVRLLIEGMPSKPFSMQTMPPLSLRRDPLRPDIIRRSSRRRYARPLEKVEQEIHDAFAFAQ